MDLLGTDIEKVLIFDNQSEDSLLIGVKMPSTHITTPVQPQISISLFLNSQTQPDQ